MIEETKKLNDFSKYLEKYKDKAYSRDNTLLLPVSIQLIILDEFCADNALNPTIEITSMDISPLAHTVAVSLTLFDKEKVLAKYPGISCIYSMNHEELTRHGPTERVLTAAIGKALSYAGIRYGNATRSYEEHMEWERANSNNISAKVSRVAVVFSMLTSDVRYEAKKQGLDLIRISKIVSEDITTEQMALMINDGSMLKMSSTVNLE